MSCSTVCLIWYVAICFDFIIFGHGKVIFAISLLQDFAKTH